MPIEDFFFGGHIFFAKSGPNGFKMSNQGVKNK